MANTKIGKITHYFDKIGVCVVDLSATLKVGDKVKISGHDNEFEQEITSMQIEHEQVQQAGKGKSVGLKVDQPVREGDEVYKVK